MKAIMERLKEIFAHTESAHAYLGGKTTEEKLALIARAHSIYFRQCNLVNYEDIMKRWLHAAGFKIRTSEVCISPYSVQSRYGITGRDQLCLSIIFTTQRVQG